MLRLLGEEPTWKVLNLALQRRISQTYNDGERKANTDTYLYMTRWKVEMLLRTMSLSKKANEPHKLETHLYFQLLKTWENYIN